MPNITKEPALAATGTSSGSTMNTNFEVQDKDNIIFEIFCATRH